MTNLNFPSPGKPNPRWPQSGGNATLGWNNSFLGRLKRQCQGTLQAVLMVTGQQPIHDLYGFVDRLFAL